MARKTKIERFNEKVLSRFQIYNSLFLTLPFKTIKQTSLLMPLFAEHCRIEYEKNSNPKKKVLVVAGGVAANKNIRSTLKNLCKDEDYHSVFPPIELCGDNAAMIALVGLEKFKLKKFDELDFPAKPRWALDESAIFLKGAGVKL